MTGLPHETSRPDRDQFVEINMNNLRTGTLEIRWLKFEFKDDRDVKISNTWNLEKMPEEHQKKKKY